MTQRMLVMPPSDRRRSTITVAGRTHTCDLGSTITVPYQDGLLMLANGWLPASVGGSGSTAERLACPPRGAEFHDTTIGAIIRFDGTSWRHALNGAVV